MNPTTHLRHPFDDEDGDSLHEECGVFGAINAGSEAATTTALGLHALQHRGQEAAGISSFDGAQFYTRRGLGHVAENFSSAESIAELPGFMAAGHVRYSTTGGSGLRNVQPFFAELEFGGLAVAHNGNVTNAMTVQRELQRSGAIFSSTSDTETLLHLVAVSPEKDLLSKFIDGIKKLEGAYSFVALSSKKMINKFDYCLSNSKIY